MASLGFLGLVAFVPCPEAAVCHHMLGCRKATPPLQALIWVLMLSLFYSRDSHKTLDLWRPPLKKSTTLPSPKAVKNEYLQSFVCSAVHGRPLSCLVSALLAVELAQLLAERGMFGFGVCYSISES